MSFHAFTALIVCIFLSRNLQSLSALIDNIGPSQSVNEGTRLVSKQGTFELGFFRPGSSDDKYLGIWYKNIPVQTVIWVANRCDAINDSSGLLTVNSAGDLVLSRQNGTVVWSPRLPRRARNPTLQLLDSGNLVLKDENNDYLWQSFDVPTDTALPGMKIGWDLKRGLNRKLTAWKNWDDPCPGDLVYGFDISDNRYSEGYMRRGTEKMYRFGPWNGVGSSGTPELRPNHFFNYSMFYNGDEFYFSYSLADEKSLYMIVLNETGKLTRRFSPAKELQSLSSSTWVPRDFCDEYGLCGVNSNCIAGENPVCRCLEGFRPKDPESWSWRRWSEGCVRVTALNCSEKERDAFVKGVSMKIPETSNAWFDDSMSLSQCRDMCLRNCSCTAYSNTDISGKGKGCRIWLGDLIDIREILSSGQDIYIRVSASEIDNKKSGRRVKLVIIVAIVGGIVSGIVMSACFCWKRINGKNAKEYEINYKTEDEDFELPLFKLETLITATDNFSLSNKIGEGGFGPVYKGKLEDGQEVAVKRLSSSSHQGMNEFRNEVTLIAKLQHRNLVRVLGCCVHGTEKLLVYEYMPNKSLDFFIFGQAQSRLLEWPKRFQIICGIARGLLYLHQDSRLRIVHRDLKTSNVLLDNDMNPKISDFGLARTFGGDQTEANTNRIVGTHGYLAPEYAFSGKFSTKSDIFSFGIMLLEIVSGKKSISFQHENDGLTLTGHAWTLLKEGRQCELIDARLRDSNCNLREVFCCIKVGLLCVQQRPIDRPDMSSVVLMLSSDENALPEPKPPGYFVEIETHQQQQQQENQEYPSSEPEYSSRNSFTITSIHGR